DRHAKHARHCNAYYQGSHGSSSLAKLSGEFMEQAEQNWLFARKCRTAAPGLLIHFYTSFSRKLRATRQPGFDFVGVERNARDAKNYLWGEGHIQCGPLRNGNFFSTRGKSFSIRCSI